MTSDQHLYSMVSLTTSTIFHPGTSVILFLVSEGRYLQPEQGVEQEPLRPVVARSWGVDGIAGLETIQLKINQ